MSIRTARAGDPPRGSDAERYHRKADQHWDMAGEARRDRDTADAERHTRLAREFEQKYREALS